MGAAPTAGDTPPVEPPAPDAGGAPTPPPAGV
jgi:hypothetical protein